MGYTLWQKHPLWLSMASGIRGKHRENDVSITAFGQGSKLLLVQVVMNERGFDVSDARPTPRSGRFSLPANYDPELVPALAEYPIDEVYGKFPADGISGGRPRYLATPLWRLRNSPPSASTVP